MTHNLHNILLPKPIRCCVCGQHLDGLYCTNNVCETCCTKGNCPSVPWCKAVKDGIIKVNKNE